MPTLHRRSTRGFVVATFGLALALATVSSAAADPPADKAPAEQPADAKSADAKAEPTGATGASQSEEAAAPEEQAAPPKKQEQKPSREPTWQQPMRAPPLLLPPPPPTYILPPLPRRLDYEEGDVILPEYQLKTRGDRALLTSGSITFGVPYLLSFLFGFGAAIEDGKDDVATPLLIPVVGPFISASELKEKREPYGTFMLLADGFAQIAGVAMFTAGLVFPTKYLEVRPEALAKTRPEVLVGPGSIAVRGMF